MIDRLSPSHDKNHVGQMILSFRGSLDLQVKLRPVTAVGRRMRGTLRGVFHECDEEFLQNPVR